MHSLPHVMDPHEVEIMRAYFTDVETEVWRGHLASHSEQGIEIGFQANLGEHRAYYTI